ncbi:hypothetical protein PHAVU_003G097000 [Phaseolus vulgaris]|uniref:Uncharacterized protein n=1 Tax=Phaseolus vulgaris TaxID=3885 RepID=V7CA95_PHAVU|nr:hypothetical protein PHAVU_003G097000g [Phaseolus vulgaris]ESW26175.1 hypothetical protein PHAVU_003G097000g [Phaseolus vulgaris]
MTILEMLDSVNKKRIELEFLRRSKTLSRILETQIPYLDEWSTMTEEIFRLRLLKMLGLMSERWEGSEFNIENVGKAEEIDVSISELARIVGGERPLVGECGDLLSKTYKSQVEECCLRGGFRVNLSRLSF